MSWLEYAVKRIGMGLVILVGVSMVVFSIIRLVPGDPAETIIGQFATEQALTNLRRQLGLHLPIWKQYLVWAGGIVAGDWGVSVHSGKPVIDLMAERYPRSLEIALLSMAISIIIAFPIGVFSAIKRNTFADYVAMFFSQVGVSIPSFWLGLMFILVFAKYLNLLPPSGYVPITQDPIGNLSRAFLPSLTLGIINAAVITRFLRSSILEELGQDYIQTARATGQPPRRIIGKYVLKNALIPTLTIIGIQFGYLMGGLVIIEQVFSWPGVGRLIIGSIQNRDYPMVQAGLLALASTFVIVNLFVDLAYAWLDPKIRY